MASDSNKENVNVDAAMADNMQGAAMSLLTAESPPPNQAVNVTTEQNDGRYCTFLFYDDQQLLITS